MEHSQNSKLNMLRWCLKANPHWYCQGYRSWSRTLIAGISYLKSKQRSRANAAAQRCSRTATTAVQRNRQIRAAGNHGISREIITSSSKTVAQILTDRKAKDSDRPPWVTRDLGQFRRNPCPRDSSWKIWFSQHPRQRIMISGERGNLRATALSSNY